MTNKIIASETDINIVLIDQEISIRSAIANMIDNIDGYFVAGQYSSFLEAKAALIQNYPDIVLLAIELIGMNTVDTISLIKKIHTSIHIIALTKYGHSQIIFTALRNGAAGCLNKNTTPNKMIEAIGEVMNGGGVMSPDIASLVIQSFQKNTNTPLSQRESQVLEGISIGKSRRKMAEELFLDIETIKTHIKNIYQKLNVNSKEEALQVAKLRKLI
jgi:DNA-binding NarL/FixJ family response regulator